jgi:hypothetical protein
VTPTSCLSSYRPIPPLSRQASFRIAAAWVSMLHAIACRQLGVRHLRTRPRRPQTNGKAERFIRTMLNGWAYAAIYRSSTERAAALDGWLWHYNHRRRHSALGHQPPVSRTNLPGSYSWRRHRVGVLSRRRRHLTRNRRCRRPWHLPSWACARVAHSEPASGKSARRLGSRLAADRDPNPAGECRSGRAAHTAGLTCQAQRYPGPQQRVAANAHHGLKSTSRSRTGWSDGLRT